MQAALADSSFAELLERVAERTPAPGGGSTAAVTCALAAALVEMAARFAQPGSPASAVAGRAAELRALAARLADDDLTAYVPVLDALRLPADAPERAQRVARAQSRASQPPLGVAQAGAEVAELGVVAARSGSPHLLGDAVAGVLLAAAASRAAAELVGINLSAAEGGEGAREQARESADRAAEASRQICAMRRIDL